MRHPACGLEFRIRVPEPLARDCLAHAHQQSYETLSGRHQLVLSKAEVKDSSAHIQIYEFQSTTPPRENMAWSCLRANGFAYTLNKDIISRETGFDASGWSSRRIRFEKAAGGSLEADGTARAPPRAQSGCRPQWGVPPRAGGPPGPVPRRGGLRRGATAPRRWRPARPAQTRCSRRSGCGHMPRVPISMCAYARVRMKCVQSMHVCMYVM